MILGVTAFLLVAVVGWVAVGGFSRSAVVALYTGYLGLGYSAQSLAGSMMGLFALASVVIAITAGFGVYQVATGKGER